MATTAYTALALLRDALAAVDGVKTSKIGLEATIKPDDYPLVRVVPSTLAYGDYIGRRQSECLVYFGQPIHEFTDGMEALYASLLTMEAALIEAATAASGFVCEYLETVTDEDRIPGYKLMALRVRIEG